MIGRIASLMMVLCVPLFLLISLSIAPCTVSAQPTFDRIDVPSTFNPVGSGARALGMGGAFIAVADDATAASWNPGGLIQLERPEISAVGAYFHRTENNHFGTNPEANGPESVSDISLNYLSAAYPFVLFDHNMIVSVNYQHLFDFNREWNFALKSNEEAGYEKKSFIDIDQSGSLYALGLAYSVQVLPTLSLGFTLNFWEDALYENQWKKSYHEVFSEISRWGVFYDVENSISDHISFNGFNFNLGILWQATDKLTVGAVFKSPFTADLRVGSVYYFAVSYPENPDANMTLSRFSKEDQELDMPMSYGIGIAYRFSDEFTVSADIYRTDWDDFVLTDSEGRKTSPISGLSTEASDIDPTYQVRLGAEYLFVRQKYAIPLRGGLFYDPAPAERNPDDYFGFTLGSGIIFNRFSFDVAYQYRFGRDVGGSILMKRYFSQDIDEHTLYSSVIFYF